MIPYRHILVPLDGSALAEKAIKPAFRIAGRMQAAAEKADGMAGSPVRLVFLRAITPMTMVAADPMVYDELSRLSQDEALAYLRQVRSQLPEHSFDVDAVVINGSSAEAIVQYAETHDIDLVVISSHGRTGSSRWVYGSVAEKVLHHAPCAVAVIRAQATIPLFEKHTILVPLDGSELAEQAIAPAMALADCADCDVYLLRVLGMIEPIPEGLLVASREYQDHLEAARQRERAEAEAYLQQVYSESPSQHLFFDVISTTDDVAEAINRYAAAHHVDLIVMSSHGRSGLSRWLFGSVAEKVLRGAPCTTLVVKGQPVQPAA